MRFILLIAVLTAFASAANYDGYKVVTVRPQTKEDAALILNAVDKLQLDLWSHPKALGLPMDIMMNSRQASSFTHILKAKGIPVEIKISDVQKVIDEQQAVLKNMPKKNTREFDHTAYHNLDEIYGILDELESTYSDIVGSYVAGTTYEGRPIRVNTVSSDGENTKPVIWIDCGIHAREWVSTATCQYILDQLTSGSDSINALLDQYDFHILTVTNPDGYVFTWSDDRVWRKNRVPWEGPLHCHGTDPNRNFDADFGGPGTSDSPCSDIYHGPSAFSAAESSAVRDSVLNLDGRVAMFFTIHSYSQLWMTPYGYTHDLPADYDEQYRVAEIAVKALAAVHGTEFAYGNIADIIYEAAGGSIDWTYDTAGIKYSFALELRDTGSFGFLLPPEQILPSGEETWAGIKASIEAITTNK